MIYNTEKWRNENNPKPMLSVNFREIIPDIETGNITNALFPKLTV